MKKISCFILVIVLAQVGNAQFKLPKALVAAHIIYAGPVSTNFSNDYTFGLGGEVEAGAGLGKTMLTGIVGYISYSPNGSVARLNATSIKIGIRQYLVAGFFLNVNGGNAVLKYNGTDGSTSKFVMEGGAGFKLLGFEVLANYGGFTTPVRLPNGSYFAGSFIVKAGFALKI